jgi:hypothetical protein
MTLTLSNNTPIICQSWNRFITTQRSTVSSSRNKDYQRSLASKTLKILTTKIIQSPKIRDKCHPTKTYLNKEQSINLSPQMWESMTRALLFVRRHKVHTRCKPQNRIKVNKQLTCHKTKYKASIYQALHPKRHSASKILISNPPTKS